MTSTPLTISTTKQTDAGIYINPGIDADITLDSVNIQARVPFNIANSSDANNPTKVHLTIADNSSNIIKVTATESDVVQTSGIRCGEGSYLTIDDSIRNVDENGEPVLPEQGRVSRDATLQNGMEVHKGDRLTILDSQNPGSLEVYGGPRGAAIGGCGLESSGNMTFNGGNIEAIAYDVSSSLNHYRSGAGIGGGQAGGGTSTTINGGKIYASGSYHGAGIGAGCTTGRGLESNNSHALDDAKIREDLNTYYIPNPGNITINGGYIKAEGHEHGNAFGTGCYGSCTMEGSTILITGGTLLPSSLSSMYDIGGKDGDVIITGGSVRVATPAKFQSKDGNAYGDLEKTQPVIMTTVNLESFGLKEALVDDMDMKIAGVSQEYGMPSYTDDQGKLYFWLPNNVVGKEIMVDLNMKDENGDDVATEPFFVTEVSHGAILKQYVIFEIENDLENGLLKKRYDGLGYTAEQMNQVKAQIVGEGIDVTVPEGGKLTDLSAMQITSQQLEDDGETVAKDAPIVEGLNPNAGKYQLIFTSTQYSNDTANGFNEAYWGHRGYYKYVEITPADTQTKLTVSGVEVEDGKLSPGSDITLSAMVRPKDGEATTCASPKGYVQFYINGQKYGEPVKVTEHVKDTTSDNYNYSTAQIKWKPIDSNIANVEEIQEIKAVYIGEDPNYTTSEGTGEIKLSFVDVDTDENGNPDVNIDVDGDGIPDINIDTDRDWKPDVNVDIDGDKKPDVNIDTDNSGTWKPSTEGGNEDGIWKPDTSLDTNGDGKVDEDHIYRPGYDIDKDGVDDSWNPDKDVDLDGDDKPEYDTSNPGINIDTDGDGNPDINIDVDGDGIPDINIDTDVDGLPDVNIDLNGDKLPEINVDTDNSGTWKPSGEGGNGDGIWKPDTSLDTNGDGKVDIEHGYRPGYDFDKDGVDDSWNPDKNVDKDKDGNSDYDTSNPNINVDTDGDGKPDINIDTDKDGNPDVNVDTNGDGKPDINVDVDGDKIPDINVDTNEDGYPDINVDTDGDKKPDINIDTDNSGTWKPSTDGGNEDGVWKPDTDIDTDGDGEADVDHLYRDPVDEDGDGVDDYWKPTIIVPEDGDRIAYGTGDIFYIDSVKTSDENNMGLYMLLSFISLAGVIGIGIGLKRKQSNL